ncbi:MAG: CocE/NonD family hydrolase [Euryarchaeota archaeon]|nr:CocE/NonD family hydrolase [Euryarchaeota archaeon]
MRPRMLLMAFVLVAPVLAGCLSDDASTTDLTDPTERIYEDLAKAYEEALWDTTHSWSVPITPPLYDRLPSVIHQITSFDGTPIELGIFRPDIPGCPTDLGAAEFPEECKTPVIMDSGPYYTPSSIGTESTRPPTAIWMVPHGYTVVYMAVRGTGGSGGCMEFMSLNEQKDVDATVTWLGEAPWSTGAVGMIGRSYDGTTPFMAAAFGNPYLKTIVPISGVSDVPDLMFSNGTSEFRGPIMHNVVYWTTFGIGMEPTETADSQVCEEVAKGTATGAYTSATGDWSVAGQDDYWEVRKWREPILENYDGSLYIIHGMQDWNVNPRMVVPWINELQDSGLKVKALLGQWGHAYPDRTDEHENTRWDWAETLVRWFDAELKGIDVDTGPTIEVEDHRHDWWVMDSYPARDLVWRKLALNADGTMTNESEASGNRLLANPAGQQNLQRITLTSEEFSEPVRVSGLVRMDLKVTPSTATGGNVYFQLYDIYPDGRAHWMGQGWMNVLYHEGGNEKQTLTPGQAVIAKMESEPLEAFLPAGHKIRLVIDQEFTGSRSDGNPKPETGPMVVHLDGDSVLKLPIVTDFTRSPYRDP